MDVALIVKQSSPSVWFNCLLASILPSVLNSLSFFYIAITQKQWIKLPIRKEGSKSILHEESVTPSAYLIKKNTEKITGFGKVRHFSALIMRKEPPCATGFCKQQNQNSSHNQKHLEHYYNCTVWYGENRILIISSNASLTYNLQWNLSFGTFLLRDTGSIQDT